MPVTNYTPGNDRCTYTFSKLRKVVYLLSAEHIKDVHIDEGEAYIDSLTELPIRLNGFNIQFNEESSLDERYQFSKTVTLRMNGYVSHTSFSGRYYVVLQTDDGTYWMVTPDFPSRVTYTFNLSQNVYQTEFTFQLLSNFPTLRLASEFEAVEPVCLGYKVKGIDTLKLIEKNYALLDTEKRKVYTYTKQFQEIEFLGNSCSLQERFDGENVTTEIDFDIAFDSYKSSWHYNLLEFTQNLYSAIITPKGSDNEFYTGFNFGLEPSFRVQTSTENGEGDKITITLTESSMRGSVAYTDITEEQRTDTRWTYVKYVGDIPCYQCVSVGMAKYLIQQEMTENGVPTGNYKVLEGYEDIFPDLNIVGTFTTEQKFNNSECTGENCKVITNIPNTVTFRSATCNTYTYSASCDWQVDSLADYLTFTPMEGKAGKFYNVTLCNTLVPDGSDHSQFTITAGDNVRTVNVRLTTSKGLLNPDEVEINCLAQTVQFVFDPNCPITVTGIDSRLSYQITNSKLIVRVPRNYSITDPNIWNIYVRDCKGEYDFVTIIQDRTYEKWIRGNGIVCDGNASYERIQRYTGTTVSDINQATGEYKAGAKVRDNDRRCANTKKKWQWDDKSYYCIDGSKFKVLFEMVSYDDGLSWFKTGVTQIGDYVEDTDGFCDQEVTYVWWLSQKWICGDGTEEQ